MNLRILSNEEFLRYAHNQIDDLTSSEIERELLRRLESTAEQIEEAEGFLALAEEYDLTAEDARSIIEAHPGTAKELAELLALLDEHGVLFIGELKTLLTQADNFRSLANDAGDVFSRLHTLTEQIQED